MAIRPAWQGTVRGVTKVLEALVRAMGSHRSSPKERNDVVIVVTFIVTITVTVTIILIVMPPASREGGTWAV